MIFVTVGTEKYPFNRLMGWLQIFIQEGLIKPDEEQLVVQYGSCTVLPLGAKVYSVVPAARFKDLLSQARVVISHCGEGSIDVLRQMQRPYILVPRSFKFNEHVDDHQVELAVVMGQLGIPIGWSPGDLARFLVEPTYSSASPLSENVIQGLCDSLQQRFGYTSRVTHS